MAAAEHFAAARRRVAARRGRQERMLAGGRSEHGGLDVAAEAQPDDAGACEEQLPRLEKIEPPHKLCAVEPVVEVRRAVGDGRRERGRPERRGRVTA